MDWLDWSECREISFSSSVVSSKSIASYRAKSMWDLTFLQQGYICHVLSQQLGLISTQNPLSCHTRALWCWWDSIIVLAGGPCILCRPESHWMGFSTGWQEEEEVARTMVWSWISSVCVCAHTCLGLHHGYIIYWFTVLLRPPVMLLIKWWQLCLLGVCFHLISSLQN